MSYFELREWFESAIPWWGPFLVPVLLLVFTVLVSFPSQRFKP